MIREISTAAVAEAVRAACEEIAFDYSPDILAKLHAAKDAENTGEKSAEAPASPADMTPEQMAQFKQFMEFQKMQNAAKQEDSPKTEDSPKEE